MKILPEHNIPAFMKIRKKSSLDENFVTYPAAPAVSNWSKYFFMPQHH